MARPASMKWMALIGVLLSACVTSPSTVREDEAPAAVSSSWDEARADPTCVVPLCDEERCAFWRCQDVVEVDTYAIVQAKGTTSITTPLLRSPLVDPPSPSRWWGRPLAAPTSADPVFEIPWHNWREREHQRLAQKTYRHHCLQGPREPYEKHHIFPQEERLALWFKSKKIDIHAFTIRLPRSFHQWLHSGGPQGGQWNEAWRQFARKQGDAATPEDIWRFAGELMRRFGVMGPFGPYSCD